MTMRQMAIHELESAWMEIEKFRYQAWKAGHSLRVEAYERAGDVLLRRIGALRYSEEITRPVPTAPGQAGGDQ